MNPGVSFGPSQQEGHGGAGVYPGKGTELGKGLEHQEQLRGLGKGLSLKKRSLGEDLLSLHNSLTGGAARGGSVREQGTGEEEMASICARGGLSWVLGKHFLQAAQDSNGVPVPGGV